MKVLITTAFLTLKSIFFFIYFAKEVTRLNANYTIQQAPVQNAILLIPGIAGTGLYGTLLNAYITECGEQPLTLPRTRLWASIVQALPPSTHQLCWARKLALDWGCTNLSTAACSLDEKVYRPFPGIQVDIDDPGGVHGFDFLDYVENVGVYGTKYFHDILISLKSVGYVEADSLLGHPFDWRYPIWDFNYNDLKETIERYVSKNPGKRVFLVAHSLGAVLTTIFLNRYVDRIWKDTHIEGFASIAGAFGGSQKAIRSLLTGYNEAVTLDLFGFLNITLLSPNVAREAHRSFGSMYSLTPNTQLFNANDTVVTLRTAPEKNFSNPYQQVQPVENGSPGWHETLAVLQNTSKTNTTVQGDRIYTLDTWWKLLPPPFRNKAQQGQQRMAAMTELYEDPQVPTYCFWSIYDTPTTEVAYTYYTDDFNALPVITWDFGDNTLIKKSAAFCTHWNSTVVSKEFKNLDHMGILMDPTFITFLTSLVSGIPLNAINNRNTSQNINYSLILK